MKLWIRSQKNSDDSDVCERLIEVNDIAIDYVDENGNCCMSVNNGIPIASYHSEEQALEILDEIQNLMLNGAFAKKTNGLGEVLDYIPNNLIIYQMPTD